MQLAEMLSKSVPWHLVWELFKETVPERASWLIQHCINILYLGIGELL
jgi:hypothetical protein